MKIIIEGELTDLNTYIREINTSRWGGNSIKQIETQRVAQEARVAKAKPVSSYPVHIAYAWYCKDNRKDVDNVAFAKKFINDGLVEAGVLVGDGRKHVSSFSDTFFVDKQRPRVEITIEELTASQP